MSWEGKEQGMAVRGHYTTICTHEWTLISICYCVVPVRASRPLAIVRTMAKGTRTVPQVRKFRLSRCYGAYEDGTHGDNLQTASTARCLSRRLRPMRMVKFWEGV